MYGKYLHKKGNGLTPNHRLKENKPSFLITFGKYKIFTKSEEEMKNAVAKLKKDGYADIKITRFLKT